MDRLGTATVKSTETTDPYKHFKNSYTCHVHYRQALDNETLYFFFTVQQSGNFGSGTAYAVIGLS